MRRALGIAWMILLGEIGLFRRQPLLAVNRCPRNRGMAAAEEFLVDRLVAAAAVGGGQVLGDDEAVMVVALLVGRRLMALQAAHVFLRVHAHLIFMDDAVLQAEMALGAFAGSAHQRGAGLRGLRTRTGAVKKKGADGERKTQDDGDEYGAESSHICSVTPSSFWVAWCYRKGQGRKTVGQTIVLCRLSCSPGA